MSKMARKIVTTTLCLLVGALSMLAVGFAAPAFAEEGLPHWHVDARSAPSYLAPGQKGWITMVITNLGDGPAISTKAEPVVITDTLPPGVKAIGGSIYGTSAGSQPRLEKQKCTTNLVCEVASTVPSFGLIIVELPIEVEAGGFENGAENVVTVEGPDTKAVRAERPLKEGAATPFGVERYELTPEEESGAAELQAGAHPYQLTTGIDFNQTFTPSDFGGELLPSVPAVLRNLNTTLPAGLVGNTQAVPQCSDADFATIFPGNSNACPADTAVGNAIVTFYAPGFSLGYKTEPVPVFNLAPSEGEPARFGFEFAKVSVTLDTSLLTGKGYAVQVSVKNSSQSAEVISSLVTIWGVPGEASHDGARGWACIAGGEFVSSLQPKPKCEHLGDQHPAPFLTLPTTACAQSLQSSVSVQSWKPGAEMVGPVALAEPESLDGCEKLPFNPSITVQPDQHAASTPSGLKVNVAVPQETTLSVGSLAEADIGETTVTLPEGVTASAGAANGLEACSVAQTGFAGGEADTGSTLEAELGQQIFTAEGVSCPAASEIGEVAIRSPLIENEIKGFVYLGSQDTNPFASPLVLYMIAEDPISGTRVKLAGEVRINQTTGQLTSTFRNTPPLPFEKLELNLFDGQRASQVTPAYCRPYATTAIFAPTSGEAAAQRTSSFEPTSGPAGSPCQASGALPFSPEFQAGSTSNQAAGYTSFTLSIKRPDGDQGLSGIEMTLPPGIAAKLASVTPCPEPRPASPGSAARKA